MSSPPPPSSSPNGCIEPNNPNATPSPVATQQDYSFKAGAVIECSYRPPSPGIGISEETRKRLELNRGGALSANKVAEIRSYFLGTGQKAQVSSPPSETSPKVPAQGPEDLKATLQRLLETGTPDATVLYGHPWYMEQGRS
ncbi:hypothetical protein E8E11_008094 [Didymella keratinophila]|nr:hypothetical protein E8E11_008094 [Didymella keratinophila]